MKFSYKGYLKNIITMESEDVKSGDLVSLNEEGIAVKAKKNDRIIGVVDSVSNGYSGVQTTGYVEVGFEGIFKPGFNKILAGSEKSVVVSETGRELLVLRVNQDNTLGVIL